MTKKQLRMYEVPEIIWDTIKNTFPSALKVEDNIYAFFYGSSDKNNIHLNDEYMILSEYKLNYVYHLVYNRDLFVNFTSWKQIKIRLNKGSNDIIRRINGMEAHSYINSILLNYYTEEEIDSILRAHEAEYDEGLKQFHYTYPCLDNNIHKFINCYKYDITKAHASAIIKLFPKAEKDIKYVLIKSAKAKAKGDLQAAQQYKDYVNLYVGYLALKKGESEGKYRKTYNYIVQSVTKYLLDTLNYTGGKLLYANTDSFTIYDAKNVLNDTKEIGKFKLEYHGDIYIYSDKNYWLMQYGNDFVGSSKKISRNDIDLSKGIVAHYDVKRTLIGVDAKNKKHFREEVINLCTEKVNVVEHLLEKEEE